MQQITHQNTTISRVNQWLPVPSNLVLFLLKIVEIVFTCSNCFSFGSQSNVAVTATTWWISRLALIQRDNPFVLDECNSVGLYVNNFALLPKESNSSIAGVLIFVFALILNGNVSSMSFTYFAIPIQSFAFSDKPMRIPKYSCCSHWIGFTFWC